MRYDDSRDTSAELLRLTLPLMARQQAAFHPVSFTLWYEHVAGVNPSLSEVLAPRLEANLPLTDDETYDLYARHVIARDMQTLDHLQQRLRGLLEEAFQITAQASDHTGQFERSLEQTQHRLKSGVSLESVHSVVSELLSESQRMQVITQAVVEKLDSRAQEVGELRNALERAQSEALLDPLTGLKNRRAFERAVAQLMADASDGLDRHVDPVDVVLLLRERGARRASHGPEDPVAAEAPEATGALGTNPRRGQRRTYVGG